MQVPSIPLVNFYWGIKLIQPKIDPLKLITMNTLTKTPLLIAINLTRGGLLNQLGFGESPPL